jgi:hypothetical protein
MERVPAVIGVRLRRLLERGTRCGGCGRRGPGCVESNEAAALAGVAAASVQGRAAFGDVRGRGGGGLDRLRNGWRDAAAPRVPRPGTMATICTQGTGSGGGSGSSRAAGMRCARRRRRTGCGGLPTAMSFSSCVIAATFALCASVPKVSTVTQDARSWPRVASA